jgi:hypothetical protein
MGRLPADWRRDHQLWVEGFVLFNFAGLVVDIFLAHSENHFRNPAEYIPLWFSVAATAMLIAILPLRRPFPAAWRDIGHIVGWIAVAIGIAGVVLHLDSRFFYERTIRSLTYAAPFAAPLAYTGLGLLLIANRMIDPEADDWALWMLLLALGGFVGNFVFSLTDHAMNGFYNPLEWVPVATSACAIGCLVVPFATPVTSPYVRLCVYVLGVQALVGVGGFVLHARAVLTHASGTWIERLSGGAPRMAPLLFPNLVVLALIALSALPPRRPA